jgi:hypothetical protein
VDRTGKNGNFGACVNETFNLLPGDVADAARSDLVRKTVKNSDALRLWFRLHICFVKIIHAAVSVAE